MLSKILGLILSCERIAFDRQKFWKRLLCPNLSRKVALPIIAVKQLCVQYAEANSSKPLFSSDGSRAAISKVVVSHVWSRTTSLLTTRVIGCLHE